jgi:hypothetical protein
MAKKKKKDKKKSSIANDPLFKSMPEDLQKLLIFNEKIQNEDNEDKARKLEKALDMATKQADPYWKSFLRVAQDEVVRSFDELKGDFESGKQRLERRMNEINEDLAYNKDQLGLELQADLARQARIYKDSLETNAQNMADAGLTFSTKRQAAEQKINQANTDIVESTTRTYNRQKRQLETEALRGNADAKLSLDELTRKFNAGVTDIGRRAEASLGTSNLPSLPGYQALGDITGDLYEKKVADIEQRKRTIFNELTGASLNF